MIYCYGILIFIFSHLSRESICVFMKSQLLSHSFRFSQLIYNFSFILDVIMSRIWPRRVIFVSDACAFGKRTDSNVGGGGSARSLKWCERRRFCPTLIYCYNMLFRSWDLCKVERPWPLPWIQYKIKTASWKFVDLAKHCWKAEWAWDVIETTQSLNCHPDNHDSYKRHPSVHLPIDFYVSLPWTWLSQECIINAEFLLDAPLAIDNKWAGWLINPFREIMIL